MKKTPAKPKAKQGPVARKLKMTKPKVRKTGAKPA